MGKKNGHIRETNRRLNMPFEDWRCHPRIEEKPTEKIKESQQDTGDRLSNAKGNIREPLIKVSDKLNSNFY